MPRAFLTRLAACTILGSMLLVACRKRTPPLPPRGAITAVPPVAPVPSSTAIAAIAATDWQYIQAIGVNATSILLSVNVASHSGTARPPETSNVPLPAGFEAQFAYLVVDLTSGCIVKSDRFPMVDEASSRTLSIGELTDVVDSMNSMLEHDASAPPPKRRTAPEIEVKAGPARVLPIVDGPIFHEQFARKQKLFAEFGANGDNVSAWSLDGTRALIAADDQMYRSDDGLHFSVIDVNASYGPRLTHDGRVGVYRRCSHPCGGGYRLAQIALGHPSSPRFVVGPDMHDYAFDPDQTSVIYARHDQTKHQLCIERLSLDASAITHLACEPTSLVLSENVLSMSDDASFGALEIFGAEPSHDPHLVIYDLRTGTRSRVIDAMESAPPVDGEGSVALRDIASGITTIDEAAGAHSAGVGEALAWDHRGRIVLLHRAALADPSKCGVVSAVAPNR